MFLPDDMDLLPKYKKTAIIEFELALTHALLFLISKAKARRTPEPIAASRPARFLTFCTEADKRKKSFSIGCLLWLSVASFSVPK